MATQPHRPSWRHLILYLLWFVVGLLLGYYLGYDHGWERQLYKNTSPSSSITCNALSNISPQSGAKVSSPLVVTMTVNNTKSCKWTVFEAQAGIAELKDSTGQKIGTATLTTTQDWMTDQPVVYTGTIEFTTNPASSDLTLTITEEDPS